MKQVKILWVDDEIDLLKPHILFLEAKDYLVITANNGQDALDIVTAENVDLILLDENMPGISGLQTLDLIKQVNPSLPVVMITKVEEEHIMEEAIGSKISDYLIKPVNPNQILLAIKKNVDNRRLVTQKITSSYQSEFGRLSHSINEAVDFNDWVDVYKRLVYWEMEMEASSDPGMNMMIVQQKHEATHAFVKYIKHNYFSWFNDSADTKPLLSHNLFSSKILPLLDKAKKTVFILIDNFRYDQWKTILPDITEYFNVEREDLYCSILPTATQYARNAIFAGLMPLEIERLHPELWVDDEELGSKNPYEEELLRRQLKRVGYNSQFYFEKVLHQKNGKKLSDNICSLLNYPLTVLVYNFVDMLSHARTEMELIKELASNEPAYRSITRSWFQHSHLLDLLKELSTKPVRVVITSDHGSIKVENAIKVVGDRRTTTNLRFKQGKNLNYDPRQLFEVRDPLKIHLPKNNVSSSYIFATGNDFLVYPNNFNYFVNYYKNTFQHGGVSIEEMMVPCISLESKG